MKRFLVDSDFLVGVFREGDANHEKAMEILKRIKGEEAELWISNLVQQESATVVSHKVGMEAVRQYIKILVGDIQRVVRVDEALERSTWGIFLKQTKKGCSFVDCSNLAVIKKYKLDGIMAFDEFYPKELRVGV